MSKIGLNLGTYDRCCGNCVYSQSGMWDHFVKCNPYGFYPFAQLVCRNHKNW